MRAVFEDKGGRQHVLGDDDEVAHGVWLLVNELVIVQRGGETAAVAGRTSDNRNK